MKYFRKRLALQDAAKKNLFHAHGPKPENTTIYDAKKSRYTKIKFELTPF